MVLVFLCVLLTLIIISSLLIICSTIRIRIDKLYINYNEYKKLEKKFNIYFEIYLFNKIKLLSKNVTEKKLKNLNIQEKIKKLDKFDFNKKSILNKENTLLLRKLKIKLSELQLEMKIGTDSPILTSSIVVFISTFISIILGIIGNEYNSDLYYFIINPCYINKNILKIDLKSIVNINVVHIIYVIYMLLKKRRVNENERTSNRRTYDYSYE